MKDIVKRVLKIVGHAFTVAVHERLDHVDHALDLVIDQNNRMARTQTALLQSSIHQVNALNRLQADVIALRRSVERATQQSEEVEAAADSVLADAAELAEIAEDQTNLIRSATPPTNE